MVKVITQMANQRVAADRRPRRTRSPQIKFARESYLQLCLVNWVHPILPGETLKGYNINFRSRQADLAYDTTGLWQNYYLFYVPVRALASFSDDDFTTVNGTLTAVATANSHNLGEFIDGNKVVTECAETICNEYFRLEAERPAGLAGPAWNMRIGHADLMESYIQGATPSYDFDVDLDADGTLMASELEDAQQRWAQMQMIGLTEMSYEEWLESMNLKTPDTAYPRPELIRFGREWKMPTRLVETSDGTLQNYCIWDSSIKSDKRKFFREPGFLVMCSAMIPNMYKDNQYPGVGMFNTPEDWEPPWTRDNPLGGMKTWDAEKGPMAFGVSSAAYTVDRRDTLEHGDQFMYQTGDNWPTYTVDESSPNYIPSSDLESMTNGAGQTAGVIVGRAKLDILGHVRDQTLET